MFQKEEPFICFSNGKPRQALFFRIKGYDGMESSRRRAAVNALIAATKLPAL